MGESVEGGRSGCAVPRGMGDVEQEDGASSKVEIDSREEGARGICLKKEEMDSREQAREGGMTRGTTGDEG